MKNCMEEAMPANGDGADIEQDPAPGAGEELSADTPSETTCPVKAASLEEKEESGGKVEGKKKKKRTSKVAELGQEEALPSRGSRRLRGRPERKGVLVLSEFRNKESRKNMFKLSGDVDLFESLCSIADELEGERVKRHWAVPVSCAEKLNDALAENSFGVSGVDLARHF